MKPFKHVNARTIDEAARLLEDNSKAKLIAGGTDLLGVLKDRILIDYPETVINIKTVPDLDYIKEDVSGLKIGALAKLEDIARSPVVREKYTILGEAAEAVATPQIRRMGTIGGNLCQDVRCWYYRSPNQIGGRINCYLKGDKECYALTGENQYHSIFGGLRVTDTPCQSACPGGVAISSYLSKFRKGDLREAAMILLESNPIPSITGRVCPHFCEQVCNRGSFDEPVSVRDIERFIGDYILENANELIRAPEADTGKSVAVVGSGPAGLSTAYYLRMAGHRVTVFDKMEEAGGLLTYVIPAYRLPKDIVRRSIKAIENIGVKFKLKVDIGKDITLDNLKENFDRVFIATGAWNPLSIGLDGEESTIFGMEFLANILRGIRQTPGKKVLVIGGGNAAIDVAISSLRLGAEEVTMACLECMEEMPALPWEIEQAIEENVKLMPSWGPHKVLKSNGKVTGMELIRCTSVYDKKGLFAPCYDDTVKETVEADCIIMAVGYVTDLKFAEGTLETRDGLIITDTETQATNVPGIFAGGAVAHGPATVIEAIAAGKRAAFAMDTSLKGPRAADKEDGRAIEPFLKFNTNYLKKTSKLKASKIPVSERTLDIEDTPSSDLSEIETEANRCFNCGCLSVNASDIGVVLMALNAMVNLVGAKGIRTIPVAEFFNSFRNILEEGQIVTEIQVPPLSSDVRQTFVKFRLRESIDFALVSVASVIITKDGICQDARIVLGAVAPRPVQATDAEKVLIGRAIDDGQAATAAQAAVEDAIPLRKNSYKVNIAKEMVRRAILPPEVMGK
jgi:NADPH-dependent glutamate synthase beta subunit-like oxidoreductase/CO/xanthine dehydrogenase FAD-binding subunit